MGRPKNIERGRMLAELYHQGLSTYEIGRRLGISGNSVWDTLKRHGYPRRPRPTAAAIVVYKGDRYAPDKDGGLRATNTTVRSDPTRFYLLRRIWIEHHGPIPEGHTIVPRNGDKTDYRIENLECLSKGETVRRLALKGNKHTVGYVLATYPEKNCLHCGAKMVPHVYKGGRRRETCAAFILRKTCGNACARAYLKGKPMGSTHADTKTWKDYATRAPKTEPKRLATAKLLRGRGDQRPQDHLGLVFQAAGKLARVLECDTGELIGDAYLSMVEAVRTFKPEKGNRFSTHATTALKFRLYKAAMEDRGKRRDNSAQARAHGRPWRDPLGLRFASGGGKDGELGGIEAGHVRGMVGGIYEVDVAAGEAMDLAAERARDLAKKTRRLTDHAEEVLHLMGRGLNQTQVARALGLSRQRVQQIVEAIAESKACRKVLASGEDAA